MIRRFFLLSVISLCSLGCRQPSSTALPTVSPNRLIPPPRLRRYRPGLSIEKRPVECLVLGSGSEVTLFLAVIHGNESAGAPLLQQFAEYLQQHYYLLHNRKVLLVPVANPDGLARNRRFNTRHTDLNRNFPADNWSKNKNNGPRPLSEPESRIIYQIISQHAPQRIISIHQPLNCIDYDGPAQDLAQRMAQACSLPLRKLGAYPGSLGSYAGDTLGIPIVTLELPRSADRLTPARLFQQYGSALLAAVVYP